MSTSRHRLVTLTGGNGPVTVEGGGGGGGGGVTLPTITGHPLSRSYTDGQPVVFTVGWSSGTGPYQVTWEYSATPSPYSWSTLETALVTSAPFTDDYGFGGADTDAGYYRAVIRDQSGAGTPVVSNVAALIYTEPTQGGPYNPSSGLRFVDPDTGAVIVGEIVVPVRLGERFVANPTDAEYRPLKFATIGAAGSVTYRVVEDYIMGPNSSDKGEDYDQWCAVRQTTGTGYGTGHGCEWGLTIGATDWQRRWIVVADDGVARTPVRVRFDITDAHSIAWDDTIGSSDPMTQTEPNPELAGFLTLHGTVAGVRLTHPAGATHFRWSWIDPDVRAFAAKHGTLTAVGGATDAFTIDLHALIPWNGEHQFYVEWLDGAAVIASDCHALKVEPDWDNSTKTTALTPISVGICGPQHLGLRYQGARRISPAMIPNVATNHNGTKVGVEYATMGGTDLAAATVQVGGATKTHHVVSGVNLSVNLPDGDAGWYTLVIDLGAAVVEGNTYNITIAGTPVSFAAVSYVADADDRSSAVSVPAVIDSRKTSGRAMVHQLLNFGTSSSIDYTGAEWQLKNAAGTVVQSGTLVARLVGGLATGGTEEAGHNTRLTGFPPNGDMTHGRVFEAEFDPSTLPNGVYRVCGPEIGSSAPFLVDDDGYGLLARLLRRALYRQRRSQDDVRPFVRFGQSAVYHPVLGQWQHDHYQTGALWWYHPDRIKPGTSIWNDAVNGYQIEASILDGTWPGHPVLRASECYGRRSDAGDDDDYAQHIRKAMLDLMMLVGFDGWQAWRLNIPETGGVLPDVLADDYHHWAGWRRMRYGSTRGPVHKAAFAQAASAYSSTQDPNGAFNGANPFTVLGSLPSLDGLVRDATDYSGGYQGATPSEIDYRDWAVFVPSPGTTWSFAGASFALAGLIALNSDDDDLVSMVWELGEASYDNCLALQGNTGWMSASVGQQNHPHLQAMRADAAAVWATAQVPACAALSGRTTAQWKARCFSYAQPTVVPSSQWADSDAGTAGNTFPLSGNFDGSFMHGEILPWLAMSEAMGGTFPQTAVNMLEERMTGGISDPPWTSRVWSAPPLLERGQESYFPVGSMNWGPLAWGNSYPSNQLGQQIAMFRVTLDAFRAHYTLTVDVVPDDRWLEAALECLDYSLGRNPVQRSYVCGVGWESPWQPLMGGHKQGVETLEAGHCIMGPNEGYWANGVGNAAIAKMVPNPTVGGAAGRAMHYHHNNSPQAVPVSEFTWHQNLSTNLAALTMANHVLGVPPSSSVAAMNDPSVIMNATSHTMDGAPA